MPTKMPIEKEDPKCPLILDSSPPRIRIIISSASVRACDRTLELYGRLREADPTAYAPQLALVTWKLGSTYQTAGAAEIAERLLRQALSLYTELDRDDPFRYGSCINDIHARIGDRR